jgi:hypothetical protein
MTVTIDGTVGVTTPNVIAPLLTTTGYTVATLPAAGTAGRRAHVSNALTPVFGSVAVGGGAVYVPVFDTGTTWIVG